MTSVRSLLWKSGLAVAALAGTLLPALGTSIAFFPADVRRIDGKAGETVYRAKCETCHALADGATGYGPSLHNIGKSSPTRKPGMSAAEYLRESIVEPERFRAPGSQGEMPRSFGRQLSDEQLLNVIAFLESQGGDVQYRELLKLPPFAQQGTQEPPTKLALASVERGRDLYFGKLQCGLCHPFDGLPGATLLAPNLGKVGNQTRDYLRDAILNPSKHIAPDYVRCVVSADGKVIQGRRLSQTDEQLRLLTADTEGNLSILTFELSDLEALDGAHESEVVTKSAVSAMPEYSRTIPPADLEAILDFLQTMR